MTDSSSIDAAEPFAISDSAQAITDAVRAFYQDQILPNNPRWKAESHEGAEIPAVETELRAEAKALGLWNLALPRLAEDEPGTRLSNLVL